MANIRVARRSGLVLRGGRNVRESVWIAVCGTSSTIAAGANPLLFGGFSAAALALRPFTVVRTRGFIKCFSDQVAATEVYGCAFSAAVVSDQSLAIGVTAVPTATTDKDSDLFFIYEELSGRFTFLSTIGVSDQGEGRTFDSKAMRKVDNGQDIAFTVEATPFSSGVIFQKMARMLVKLH